MADNSPHNNGMTVNDISDIDTRAGLQAYFGNSNSFQDRDLYDTFGWLEDPDEEDYYATYLRNPVAKAVVDKPAETTWRHDPEIKDGDDETETEFEQAVARLDRQLDFWNYCSRIDKLAGIGEYGILVIGFADGADLSEPVNESTINSVDDIAWFRVFPQISITDVDIDQDTSSDRWGQVESYDVDLSDADDSDDASMVGNVEIHHSRVIHVPSTELLDDEIRGTPRQEPVFNVIQDIEKVFGSASEMTYRGADYGLHVDVDPEYDFDASALNEELQRYNNQLQNFIKTQGTSVEQLGGEVTDPSGLIDTLMGMVVAGAPYAPPKRLLMGSEQAELASSQDKANYFGRIHERQTQYAEDYIAINTLRTLISVGALPKPVDNLIDLEWPDLFELNDLEQADVKKTRAQTLKNFAPQGNTDLVATAAKRAKFLETGDADLLKPDESTQQTPMPGTETPEQQEAFNNFFLNESVDKTPPGQAQTNAEAVLDVRDKTDAMTETGWRRAKQLADGGELSATVIEKMAQFKRHQSNTEYENYSDIPEGKKSGENPWWEDNGTVAWLGWGGTAGIEWAVEQSEKLSENVANANRYSIGDTVSTPQGIGVVVDVVQEHFEFDGESIESSSDSPTYMVLVEDARAGVQAYKASEIHATDLNTEVDNPENDLSKIAANGRLERFVNMMLGNQRGHFNWPSSWEKADSPARLVAMEAWASMGGDVDSCINEMRGEISQPGAFCADFADRLYGTDLWRGDTWAPED